MLNDEFTCDRCVDVQNVIWFFCAWYAWVDPKPFDPNCCVIASTDRWRRFRRRRIRLWEKTDFNNNNNSSSSFHSHRCNTTNNSNSSHNNRIMGAFLRRSSKNKWNSSRAHRLFAALGITLMEQQRYPCRCCRFPYTICTAQFIWIWTISMNPFEPFWRDRRWRQTRQPVSIQRRLRYVTRRLRIPLFPWRGIAWPLFFPIWLRRRQAQRHPPQQQQ